jgi:hypothetical protein
VEHVQDRLTALRERRSRYASPGLCDEVRDLVVVCSSSRSGSSVFGEVLRRSTDLVTTSAEINPHLTIPVLGAGIDALADPTPLCTTGEGRRIAQEELSLDLGHRAGDVPGAVLADHVAWRLTMQWPEEPVDPDLVARWVADVPSVATRDEVLGEVLLRAREAYPSIDLRRYDDAPEGVPAADEPDGPPAEPIVEMTPFVAPRRWSPATVDDVRGRPTVLATPRNAFRLRLLRSLFPNARLRVVHLTRNPAASINGLRDGWRSSAFWAGRVPEGLAIAGHADDRPEARDWWCYDLPPGWRSWTTASLEEVCAFQWRAAQAATVAACDELGLERHIVRFEDVVGAPDVRAATLRSLADWLGIDPSPLVAGEELPVVMATRPPRPARWRANADVLAGVLGDREVLRWAHELGYGSDPDGWV